MIQFLRGLNDQFSTVRFNVLIMDPLPSIVNVFSYAILIQQERKINNNDALGSTSLINATNTNLSNSPFSCTYCGRKNGFPHNPSSREGKSEFRWKGQ